MPPPSQPPPSVATGRARPAEASQHVGPIESTPVLPSKPPRKGRIGNVITIFIAAVVLLLGVRVVVQSNSRRDVAAPAASSNAAAPGVVPGSPSASPSPSATALVAGPNDPSGVPMPKGDIPGWHQTFTDDFTGTHVNTNKWAVFDGQPLHDPVGRFTPSHLSVADGMLSIGAWRSSPGNPVIATGGMSNVTSNRQTYGKWDIRFRMDKGWGIAYAILLWPSNNNTTPEIDFAEDNGTGRTMTSASLHTTDGQLIHKETHGDYTQWHTAEVIWTPTKLTYSLDGVVWTTMAGSGVPHTPMSLSLQTESHPCGMTWEVCANKTTPSKVNLQVDWVAEYQATK